MVFYQRRATKMKLQAAEFQCNYQKDELQLEAEKNIYGAATALQSRGRIGKGQNDSFEK